MTNIVTIPKAELESLRERVRNLAREKLSPGESVLREAYDELRAANEELVHEMVERRRVPTVLVGKLYVEIDPYVMADRIAASLVNG